MAKVINVLKSPLKLLAANIISPKCRFFPKKLFL